MTISTAPLGNTGMHLSRVGFGTWATGGGGWRYGWGAQTDSDSVTAIHEAVGHGVNWIDTAPIYGLGHAEEVVGAAVRKLPHEERPYVFTKCGLLAALEGPAGAPRHVLSPSSIREEVEGSLRRLQVERIDLYQVHWPPHDGTPLAEYWSTMQDLKREGKVRAVGLSNHDITGLGEAETIGHVDSSQPPLSLIDRRAVTEHIPWCQRNRTGVITYGPLQAGLLAGGMSAERVAALPGDDWRSRDGNFTGDRLRRNQTLVGAVARVGERHGVTPAAAAVAWVLSVPGVTGAIVGARRPAQVRDWIRATEVTLTMDDLSLLSDTLRHSGAGSGPEHAGPFTLQPQPPTTTAAAAAAVVD